MAKLTVREAEVGDGYALAPNLREADKLEMRAATGEVGPESLEKGIRDCEECWCMEVDGEPIALYGYRDSGDDAAYIWLMGSDVIQDVSWQFLRYCKNTMGKIGEKYDHLWSLSDKRNTTHQKWYEWLGFEILQEVKAGPQGDTFNLIQWKSEDSHVQR